MKIKNIMFYAAGLLALAGSRLHAEEAQFIRDQKLNSTIYCKMVKVGDTKAMLLAIPEVYSTALGNNLAVDAVCTPAWAVSSMDQGYIIRLSSTKARLSYNYRSLAIGTFGIKVPMGINQFSPNQERTAGILAARQLGVRYADLFNSFDISAGVSSSAAFKDVGPGDVSAGLGVAMLIKLPYQPQEGNDQSFNPGDEFNLSVAGEYAFRALDRNMSAFLDLGFTIYGSDQMGDNKVTDVGNKFNWAMSGKTELKELGDVPVQVRLANYIKGANAVERVGETTKKSSDLIISLQSGLPLLTQYQPYAQLAFGSYSGGSLAENSSFVVSPAVGGSFRLREKLFAQGEAGLDVGSYGENTVLGLMIQGTVKYQF
jgi:hypothetical protein